MSAKAVIVVDNTGLPVSSAEPTLVTDFAATDVMPLTNSDGYSLSHKGYGHTNGYLKVVANGYLNYLQHVTLDDDNQNIMVGAEGGGDNAIHLPPLSKASGIPFPSYPTREEVCNVFCGFQGVEIATKEFGVIRAFGPECGALSDEDTISYCMQMKAFGFTHVEFDISWQYSEPGFSYPVPGLDLAYNLQEACRRLDLIIRQGMFVKLSLAGDGMSINNNPRQGEYNDPQGWTYGYQWLNNNLERIVLALQNYNGHDLTRFICFVPGYDGVFYGWSVPNEIPDLQPARVINFGNFFRIVLPNGFLGLEHSTGKIPVGEDGFDWTVDGPLNSYDTLFSEFNPFNLASNDTWQIVGRLTRPYNRPPDQPINDDPHPPMIFHDCTRGKRFYILYELLTFLWVRGEISLDDCNFWYDYFKAMAPDATLCMVRQ